MADRTLCDSPDLGKVFALGCATLMPAGVEPKEHKRDPRLGEFCHMEDPALLDFDEDHVLASILPELVYHRSVAKANIQHAAQIYKQRYDAKNRVRPHTFSVGDQVWVRTSRPSGQAVGKTDKANRGPYRIMDVVGRVLFKLQDVQTGATLASLKHGDALTHCPSEVDSDLRVLQERHGDPPNAQGQGQGGDGGREIGRDFQRPDPGDETGLPAQARGHDHSVSVKQGTDHVQEIRMLPHMQKTRKVAQKQKAKAGESATGPARPQTPAPTSLEPAPSAPSVHGMKLRARPQ